MLYLVIALTILNLILYLSQLKTHMKLLRKETKLAKRATELDIVANKCLLTAQKIETLNSSALYHILHYSLTHIRDKLADNQEYDMAIQTSQLITEIEELINENQPPKPP